MKVASTLKLNLFIIGCGGIPARYGGFETFAEQISLQFSNAYNVNVVCSKFMYNAEEQADVWNGVNRLFRKLRPNAAQGVLYDLLSLRIASKRADRIILLGTGPALFFPFFSKTLRKKIIVHVDGLEWQRPKWNPIVQFVLKLAFKVSLRLAPALIIDNTGLLKYIPVRYRHKVHLILYGGEHVENLTKEFITKEKPYALVVARAEPENNLHVILDAFREISSCSLVIISNWQQTSYGRRLFRKHCGNINLQLLDAIYDPVGLQKYRNGCCLYIHGHSAGGTNPSLVEAMYCGLPVLALDNWFNRITTNEQALYFKSASELKRLVDKISSEKLLEIGGHLKSFARANYTWQQCAGKLHLVLQNMPL